MKLIFCLSITLLVFSAAGQLPQQFQQQLRQQLQQLQRQLAQLEATPCSQPPDCAAKARAVSLVRSAIAQINQQMNQLNQQQPTNQRLNNFSSSGIPGLPGIYLNDASGKGNSTSYGIPGLPGMYVNGPGPGSGLMPHPIAPPTSPTGDKNTPAASQAIPDSDPNVVDLRDTTHAYPQSLKSQLDDYTATHPPLPPPAPNSLSGQNWNYEELGADVPMISTPPNFPKPPKDYTKLINPLADSAPSAPSDPKSSAEPQSPSGTKEGLTKESLLKGAQATEPYTGFMKDSLEPLKDVLPKTTAVIAPVANVVEAGAAVGDALEAPTANAAAGALAGAAAKHVTSGAIVGLAASGAPEACLAGALAVPVQPEVGCVVGVGILGVEGAWAASKGGDLAGMSVKAGTEYLLNKIPSSGPVVQPEHPGTYGVNISGPTTAAGFSPPASLLFPSSK